MNDLYVIIESDLSDRYDHSFDQVMGITTSQEKAVELITNRHPNLVREEIQHAREGEYQFALRGTGMDGDGGNLYFCFRIKPFSVDPSALAANDYDWVLLEQKQTEVQADADQQ